MENLTKHISTFPVLGFILGGIILYYAIKYFKMALLRIISNSKLSSRINRSYSIILIFIALLYILWAIPYFFEISMSLGVILSLILIISILLLFWFAGRDFIAGFFIRANSGFKINSRIKTDNLQGVIIEFYGRNFKLINDKGEKILIPYTNIISKNILIKNSDKSRISKHISLKIKSVENYEDLINDIRFKIMMHPKSLVNIAPLITIVSQDSNFCVFDINISARNNNGLAEIETFLNSSFE